MGGDGGEPSGCRLFPFGTGLQILLSAALPFCSGMRLNCHQTEFTMTSTSTPKPSPKSTKSTQYNAERIPTITGTTHPERLLTVGLYPEARPKTPWIRLRGLWLKEAGFTPQTRVRVQVTTGRLVITAE